VSSPSGRTPSGSDDTPTGRPHVLVLGGGFGGIGAARKLKDADVDVTLIDKHDYHTFQPLLYQVATDLLETTACGHPLRDLFHEQPHVAVHEATVTGIDLAGREVQFAEMAPAAYDYLVLSLGARANFFGVEGAEEHAFPMYTLADAVRLREHILTRWEAADRDPALVEDGAVTVVVVGGGPTGIESAGALSELYRSNFAQDYPGIPQDRARIVLVEAGPELLPMFRSEIRSYTKKALEKRGVEVLLGEVVAKIEPTRVTLESGAVIPAHTLVWGAGLQASPLADALGLELEHGNRVPVEPDLSVAGHPEVFAVGDVAWITDTKTNDVLPQLGSVALQAGEHAGENVARLVAGKDTEPFAYHDKGTMATIGRGAAVVQTRGGHTMKGKAAFLAWGAVHLALLSTGEDRAKAVVDWTWAGFTHERAGRISVRTDED
jgi:NADH:ubiquinone reductase (H+-translocating)